MTAKDIISALRTKHGGDVFLTEVKNGASMDRRFLRMDAWVMRRSWTQPAIIVYEVKTSRNDFLKDNKYLGYADYCNQLCLAAPKGLIQLEELPKGVGLVEVSETLNRVFTRRKAEHRKTDPAILESLFRYILMSRCLTESEYAYAKSREERIEEWKNRIKDSKNLGYTVTQIISQNVKKQVGEVTEENNILKAEHEKIKLLEAEFIRAGLDPSRLTNWEIPSRVLDIKRGFGRHELSRIDQLITSLSLFRDELKNLECDLTQVGVKS